LASLLERTTTALDVSAGDRERARVRRRLVRLYRRRRMRRAVGSSTVAAGMVAGGLRYETNRSEGSGSQPVAVDVVDEAASSGLGVPWSAPMTTMPPSPKVVGRPHSSTWDPILGVDRAAADPAAIYASGRYHLYTTSATHCWGSGDCHELRVPRFVTSDLSQPAQLVGDAMPDLPAWVDDDDPAIWAPSIARIGDQYVLYFAATSGRPGDGGMKCLGAAVAATPQGPFAPLPEPLERTPGYWNIDPYPVAEGDGWYLLWRQDDAANTTGKIVAARLSSDGLNVDASTQRTLLVGEYPWEEGYPQGTGGIGPSENPAMVRHPVTGEWLLTWSANRWETRDYASGLAICAGPLGPAERVSRESPWLRDSSESGSGLTTAAQLSGAGGLSFVTGPGDQLYAVLHAYDGTSQLPGAPRVGWAFRVDADRASSHGYRLTDIERNQAALRSPPVQHQPHSGLAGHRQGRRRGRGGA
jgi:hypothetical protein